MILSKLIFRKNVAIRTCQAAFLRQRQFNKNIMALNYRYFNTKQEETKSEQKEEAKAETQEKTTEKDAKTEKSGEKDPKKQSGSDSEGSVDSDEEFVLKAKDIKKLLKDQDDEIETLKKKLDNAIKQYQYQLAENDNTVKRYKDEVKKAQEFAISKFAKDMLEVRDNLQMAIDHAKKFNKDTETDINNVKGQFTNLLGGVDMTNSVFDSTMTRHNVVEYKPVGEVFNPNLHEAIAIIDDPTKDGNTI